MSEDIDALKREVERLKEQNAEVGRQSADFAARIWRAKEATKQLLLALEGKETG